MASVAIPISVAVRAMRTAISPRLAISSLVRRRTGWVVYDCRMVMRGSLMDDSVRVRQTGRGALTKKCPPCGAPQWRDRSGGEQWMRASGLLGRLELCADFRYADKCQGRAASGRGQDQVCPEKRGFSGKSVFLPTPWHGVISVPIPQCR